MKMKKIAIAGLAALFAAPALAHIGYKKDFGMLDGVITTGGSFTSSATSNAGWADAADNSTGDALLWGDSHKSAAFLFVLTNTASVTFSVVGNASVGGATGGALLPGFSIYEGKASTVPRDPNQTSADYDTSAASKAYRETLPGGSAAYSGVWNALGNWKVGGDGDTPGDFSQLSSFTYKGSAAAAGTATTATGSFLLGPGTYSVFVGGNNYGDYGNPLKYGFNVNLSVAAVPEPETYALLLAGLGLMSTIARRRSRSSANGAQQA